MRISENNLLRSYTGICNGGSRISEIDGKRVYWDYRRYHDMGAAVCTQRDDADYISLEYDRSGRVTLALRLTRAESARHAQMVADCEALFPG